MDSLIFKLLGDENRLRVVVLLYNRELCISHLYQGLKLKQANTSKILKTLMDNGVVKVSPRKNNRYYSIDEECEKKYPEIFAYIKRLQDKKEFVEDLEHAKSIKSCSCGETCQCRF